MPSVQIVEVGPRDGLQNETKKLSVNARKQLVQKLSQTGLKRIEIGSFVSPQWVPQMKGTDQLAHKVCSRRNTSRYFALVPNMTGLDRALETPLKEIAIFGSCSEGFSKKNINCTIDQSFQIFEEVVREARKNKIKVRGYLSTAFGCPYEGKVSVSKVTRLTQKMLDLGVREVSIGDTIGVATPKQVEQLLKTFSKKGIHFKKIALHMHDTQGVALANILKAYEMGIRVFDSSVGGLGGCPYAKGASGNVATEHLCYMFDGMGVRTGVDYKKIKVIAQWLQKKGLPSHKK